MISYIFFTISLLFYLGLALFTASRPSLGGDNGMGYGLGLAFFGLGFAVSSLAMTISLLAKGNFHWVAAYAGLRTATVLFAWLCVVLTILFCADFKWESNSDAENTYPQFLQVIAQWQGQIWIPLFWLAACFLSLNSSWQSSLSPIMLKAPFFAGLILSAVFTGGLVLGYVQYSVRQSEAEFASQQEQEKQYHQNDLDFIAGQKTGDPIIQLLAYTNRFHENDVRQAALAKIKAHPDWEADLLALLKNKNAYREVYYFLDGSRVTRSGEFAQALNQTIEWMAETIVHDIKDSDNLQSWSFDSYGINQLLRAIDEQFQGQGVDFRPNVRKLSQALKTTPPDRFKGVTFTVTGEVDAWLRRQK